MLNLRSERSGFTIVELLIVIIVIAMLAAISVAAYNGVQDRTRLSMAHSDMVSIKKKLMLFNIDHGHYPSTAADLVLANISISSVANYDVRPSYGNFYYCIDKVNNAFSLGARVAGRTASSFYITNDKDVTPISGLISQSRTCSTLGLLGTGEAHGAYSGYGISPTGTTYSWLNVNS